MDNFNFNLAAGAMTCRVTPLAALQILEAHQRRQTETETTLGGLLGRVSGNVVEVTEVVAIPHKEEVLDKEYLIRMLNLKKKTAPAKLSESLIGWFTTADLIEAPWLTIHNYIAAVMTERHAAVAGLASATASPLLLQVDVSKCAFKALVTTATFGADTLVQFHQLPTALSNFQTWADALAFVAEPARSELEQVDVLALLEAATNVRGDAETVEEVTTCLRLAKQCVDKIASSGSLPQ